MCVFQVNLINSFREELLSINFMVLFFQETYKHHNFPHLTMVFSKSHCKTKWQRFKKQRSISSLLTSSNVNFAIFVDKSISNIANIWPSSSTKGPSSIYSAFKSCWPWKTLISQYFAGEIYRPLMIWKIVFEGFIACHKFISAEPLNNSDCKVRSTTKLYVVESVMAVKKPT